MRTILNAVANLPINHGVIYNNPLFLLHKLPQVDTITQTGDNVYKVVLKPISLVNNVVFNGVCEVSVSKGIGGEVLIRHLEHDADCNTHFYITAKPTHPSGNTHVVFGIKSKDNLFTLAHLVQLHPALEVFKNQVVAQYVANAIDEEFNNPIIM